MGCRSNQRFIRSQSKLKRLFCAYCGKKLTKNEATVDHFIPKACLPKGFHHQNNRVIACFDCNHEKSVYTGHIRRLYSDKGLSSCSNPLKAERTTIKKLCCSFIPRENLK